MDNIKLYEEFNYEDTWWEKEPSLESKKDEEFIKGYNQAIDDICNILPYGNSHIPRHFLKARFQKLKK